MCSSRTACRLFLQTAKTILMNYSCLDSHVRSKPRGAETQMVLEVHSVANPFLFYLWLNKVNRGTPLAPPTALCTAQHLRACAIISTPRA